MKTKKYLSFLLIALCAVLFFGCGEAKSSDNIQANPMQYYVKSIRPSSFTYPQNALTYPIGVKENDKVTLRTNDYSCLEFAQDWRSMLIWLDDGSGNQNQILNFTIISCTRKDGNIKATVQRVQNSGSDTGKIITYSLWSNAKYIYLKTLVSYKIYTNDENTSHTEVTVSRNTVVMTFWRTQPSYIGGSGI